VEEQEFIHANDETSPDYYKLILSKQKINGSWEENLEEVTEVIHKKYNNLSKFLEEYFKGLECENIKIAIFTFLVLCYISDNYIHKKGELFLIVNKAKKFVEKCSKIEFGLICEKVSKKINI
jgi:hypothetical protein